ncbi:MAG: hypothetical protein L0H19_03890, partial [Salinisphaera sp.]|nr:hypothetical protein [Salinisphaera sp.]
VRRRAHHRLPRQGLSAAQLYRWRSRLRVPGTPARAAGRVTAPTAAAAPRFLAVQVRDASRCEAWQAAVSAPIQAFAGAVRFELPGLPSPQWVAALSAALTVGRE